MFTPPAEVSAVLAAFAPLFTEPTWLRVQALVCGTLLAPANHTLTAALHALGLASEPGFQNYHRVLNRARGSARQAAGVRLGWLVEAFVPAGGVILGLDDLCWNAAAAASSPAVPSRTTRCTPARAAFKRAAAYAGCAWRCWPRSTGRRGFGRCPS